MDLFIIYYGMDPNRKAWNDRHKQLHHALEKTGDKKKVTEFFYAQHAAVHSSKLARQNIYSFSDEILSGLSPDSWRYIPDSGNHSIAWIIWHLARIEDVTMNILVAGDNQILKTGNWSDKLQIKDIHTGNGMTDQEVAKLSDKIDINALANYRLAVGKKTQKIVASISPSEYKKRVDPTRIARIWEERAMLPNAEVIVNYWAGRTIAGLFLMPPTRHCFLHLNEARLIKAKAVKNLKD